MHKPMDSNMSATIHKKHGLVVGGKFMKSDNYALFRYYAK
jgi:hypothetical protein